MNDSKGKFPIYVLEREWQRTEGKCPMSKNTYSAPNNIYCEWSTIQRQAPLKIRTSVTLNSFLFIRVIAFKIILCISQNNLQLNLDETRVFVF